MITPSRFARVWAYSQPADLRKGYDGLYGLVVRELDADPLSGDCYLFINRRRTQCKVFTFDGTGLAIYSKRLEQGRFAAVWERAQGSKIALTTSELALFLDGSDLVGRRTLIPDQVVLTNLEQRRAL